MAKLSNLEISAIKALIAERAEIIKRPELLEADSSMIKLVRYLNKRGTKLLIRVSLTEIKQMTYEVCLCLKNPYIRVSDPTNTSIPSSTRGMPLGVRRTAKYIPGAAINR